MPISDKNMQSWFNMDLLLLEYDLGPRTKPLSNGPDARAQGANCFERGNYCIVELKEKQRSLAKILNGNL